MRGTHVQFERVLNHVHSTVMLHTCHERIVEFLFYYQGWWGMGHKIILILLPCIKFARYAFTLVRRFITYTAFKFSECYGSWLSQLSSKSVVASERKSLFRMLHLRA